MHFFSRPKKSLGQNFLTSEAAVFKIIQAAKIVPWTDNTVLEIGPGRGVLTTALLAAGAHVVAVEKDHELFVALQEKFAAEISAGALNIIEGDILAFSPEIFASKPYKIVANIPYNITGQIIKKFLSEVPEGQQPSLMVVLLQKEVTERIIAADKKESILSISVKAYGEPKKITVVNRGSFFPAPNVDSAVLSIENISKKHFAPLAGENFSEKKFFEVVRAGFAHKRKMLAPNLSDFFTTISKEKILDALHKAGVSEKARAEDLTLENWLQISKALSA
jgi:16S rRNA (adenine1518-N6/adenine1519-N6)-dimethyltransferase